LKFPYIGSSFQFSGQVVGYGSDLSGLFQPTMSFDPPLPTSAKNLLHAFCTKTEFIYPETWVADQTIFYRAVAKAELERSLDPPPLNSGTRQKRNVNEPVIAFGPPGSTGELNVSVIVSPVPLDFR